MYNHWCPRCMRNGGPVSAQTCQPFFRGEEGRFNSAPRACKLVFNAVLYLLLASSAWAQGAWKWIAYGDTRSNDDDHRAVLQAIVDSTPDYRFIINVGDVVADGTNIDDWNTWQLACDEVLGGTGQDQIPPQYMACPGNHDKLDIPSGLTNWHTYLPGQSQQYGNDGKYFVLDYENARIIIMDSDASPQTGEQYDMLMEAIENNPKQWLFTIWHHPIFDFGPKEYEDRIHDTWGIPLYQNGCDIMFMGHAHYYVRSKKLGLNGDMHTPVDSARGTVQLVTGNGGAPLYSVDPNADGNGYMVENYISQYGYTELTVDGDTLRLRHILTDGTVFDSTYYTPNPKSTMDGLIVGTATETHTYDTITIRVSYSGDFNGDGSASLMHKVASESMWIDDGQMERDSTGFTGIITDLEDDTEYDVKVTFADPDEVIGTNPLIFTVRTLSTKTETLSLREVHTYQTITIWADYAGDADGDGLASLDYKSSATQDWISHGLMIKEDSSYVATLTGLSQDTDYDIQVTYSDPDGVRGDSTLIITNIHTTAVATHSGTLSEIHSHSSIIVTASYQEDGDNDGRATLEHKKSLETVWQSDG
ncbi:MAG: metallophosphoesterase, partial [Candidatus Neomarinimicrobiota bacterium]